MNFWNGLTNSLEWLVFALAFSAMALAVLKFAPKPGQPSGHDPVTSSLTCALFALVCVIGFIWAGLRHARAFERLSATISPYPGASFISNVTDGAYEVWLWETDDAPESVLTFYANASHVRGATNSEVKEGSIVFRTASAQIEIRTFGADIPFGAPESKIAYRINWR